MIKRFLSPDEGGGGSPQYQQPAPGMGAAPTHDDTPVVGLDTVIEYESGGEDRMETLGEIIERASRSNNAQQGQQVQQPQSPSIDPGQLQEFQTWNKAVAGDPEAMRQLLDKHAPIPEPEVTDTPEIAELKQQISALQGQVQTMAPTYQELHQRQNVSTMNGMIESQSDNLPYLAKHPEAAHMVMAKLDQIKANAYAAGHDLSQMGDDVRIRAIAQAMKESNNQLEYIATLYGGQKLTPTQAAAVKVKNDQDPSDITGINRDGTLKSSIQFDDYGRPVRRGRHVVQHKSGQYQEIQGDVPNASGNTGSAIGVDRAGLRNENTIKTLGTMKADMMRRVQEMNTQVREDGHTYA